MLHGLKQDLVGPVALTGVGRHRDRRMRCPLPGMDDVEWRIAEQGLLRRPRAAVRLSGDPSTPAVTGRGMVRTSCAETQALRKARRTVRAGHRLDAGACVEGTHRRRTAACEGVVAAFGASTQTAAAGWCHRPGCRERPRRPDSCGAGLRATSTTWVPCGLTASPRPGSQSSGQAASRLTDRRPGRPRSGAARARSQAAPVVAGHTEAAPGAAAWVIRQFPGSGGQHRRAVSPGDAAILR